MPKKIKKNKDTKLGEKKKIINVNNIHYIFIAIIVIVVLICTIIGVNKYKADKYHVHANNPIRSFSYSEKLDEGYDEYILNYLQDRYETEKDISASHSNFSGTEDSKWSMNKFLDFNEEIYATNIFTLEPEEKNVENNVEWSIEIELVDGTRTYITNKNNGDFDKANFARIIKKYYGRDIIYQ